jgi:hypothetical protein
LPRSLPQTCGCTLCLRADDGIIVVDTCPDRETYEAFVAGAIAGLFRAHGLPDPEAVEDHPVHAAFVEGAAAGG